MFFLLLIYHVSTATRLYSDSDESGEKVQKIDAQPERWRALYSLNYARGHQDEADLDCGAYLHTYLTSLHNQST